MSAQQVSVIKFVLHGLEKALATQLCSAVSASGGVSYYSDSTPECLALAEQLPASAVFCNAKPHRYRPLLEALKQRNLRLPVVVVSRIPEVSEWLDALEAGAMDYCGAPFEQQQIRWLMESASFVAEGLRANGSVH